MRAHLHRLMLIGLLASPFGVAHAALDRWAAFFNPVFRHYNQDDGLPNPVATALSEDRDGFIWVGTEGGLARWDGYRFKVYNASVSDSTALPDGWITTLHTDSVGRLWAGTSAGGLVRFDADKDRFTTISAGVNGLSNVHVSSITDDGSNGLWIATEGGLDHVNSVSGEISNFYHRDNDPSSLPDNRVLSVLLDRRGDLWVGTRSGIARKAKGSNRFEIIPLEPHTVAGDSVKRIAVGSLFEDRSGTIWLGTTNHGAFWIDENRNTVHPVVEDATPQNEFQGQWVYSIAERIPGEIWLGTYGQGIVVVDTKTGRAHRLRHDLVRAHSLADDTVWALYRDRAGALWVGTTVGISRLVVSASAAVMTVGLKTTQAQGLLEDNVPALMVASDGRIWAGLRANGINIIDPLAGTVLTIPADAKRPQIALPDTFVQGLTEWSNRDVYVGTSRGLYVVSGSHNDVHRQTIRGRDPAARIDALMASNGRLWIAGTDDGVWVFDPTDPNAEAKHFDADRLTDRRATTFADDHEGGIWIGTRNGLNRLDLASGQVEQIQPNPANASALRTGYVSSLLFDRAGKLWIGTLGGGIQVMAGGGDNRSIIRNVGMFEELANDNIDSLEMDTAGRIWAATDGGLALIDPTTFAVRNLHRADGVVISAYWIGASAATLEGELLFGGPGGFTIVKPSQFTNWSYRPPIVITQVEVAGRVIRGNGLTRIDGLPALPIYPSSNSLAVEFAALDYSAPERNRYQYRLEGFDKDWVEANATRRLAAYTNLNPGHYTLQLRGSNREGLWTEPPLELPIRVLPAWYQTIWWKMVLAIGALLGLLGVIHGRTLLLRQRQRELEQVVAQRTAELEKSKLQIETIAYHDALTGLANRRLFSEDLHRLSYTAERSIKRFALILIDLDGFKQINDGFGHDAGDAVLVEAAQRLKATLRLSDRLARLGGDEFAILLEDLPGTISAEKAAIDALCQRVVDSFANSINYKEFDTKTSASIGVAIFPDSGSSQESLYKAADLALYAAKRGGRNTWRWHCPDIDSGLMRVS